VITSLIFSEDEETLITGSKDGYLIMRSVKSFYKPYLSFPRNPCTFDNEDRLYFKCEDPQPLLPKTSLQDIDKIKTAIEKQLPREIAILQSKCRAV